MNLEDIVKTKTDEEFTRDKTVIAGSSNKVTIKLPWIHFDNTAQAFDSASLIIEDITHIPSLFKVIDELIVNATDHFINCINKTTLQHKMKSDNLNRNMDKIIMSIDDKTGKISILNTGYGIPIVKHTSFQLEPVKSQWLPEKLFGSQRTGTNMDNDKYRVTGGTNGTGANIVISFSSEVELLIADNKFIYNQVGKRKGNSLVFEEPIIKPNDKPNMQYTCVKFLINWEGSKYKKFTKPVYNLFYSYIYKRLLYCSVFTKTYGHNVNISFKDQGKTKQINYKLEDFVKMLDIDKYQILTVEPSNKLDTGYVKKELLNFNVLVGCNSKTDKYTEINIINGVEVIQNPFVKQIINIINDKLINYCKLKKFTLTQKNIKKYLSIVFVGNIMNPQWIGQTKEKFSIDKKLISSYNFHKMLDNSQEIVEYIYEKIISSEINRKRKKKVKVDKYTPSINIKLGKKNKINYLGITEGDSAKTFLVSLASKNYKINQDNFGILNSGGVIMNTYHRINRQYITDFKYVKLDNYKFNSKLIFSDAASENKFIQSFINVADLDDRKDYLDESGLNSIDKLNPYFYFVIATDPDLDGYNIGGQIITLLSKWLGIIKNKRLLILQLPIIRIIPNELKKSNCNKVIEFFTQEEFEDWNKTNTVPNGCKVKYYKGLATIEKELIEDIAKNIDKYLYTIYWDKNAESNLEIFYGKEKVDDQGKVINISDERKEILSTPVRKMTENEKILYEKKYIAVTTFLEIYVKAYMLDNIHRKLPKLMDCQNNVSGKLLHSFSTIFKSKNNELVVTSIGSKVKDLVSYHHGDMSINKSVISAGQSFPGKKLYPFIIGKGEWGNLSDGGKKSAGSPRYINAILNKDLFNLVFRKEDNICLINQYEEGNKIEPRFYLPIIPLASLENYTTTAHGWKIESWGRDFNSVIKYILIKLNLEFQRNSDSSSTEIKNKKYNVSYLPINSKTGKVRYFTSQDEVDLQSKSRSLVYSESEYTIKDNIMHITKLPIGTWYNTYIAKLEERSMPAENKDSKPGELFSIIENIINKSADNNVNIFIYLKPNWKQEIDLLIERKTYVDEEHYGNLELIFGLRTRLCDELNFIDPNNCVVSFNNHIELIDTWYDYRLNYYKYRIDRYKEILKLQLIKYKNILRYVTLFYELGLQKKNINEFRQILENNKFDRINDNLFNPDNDIPTDKIIECAQASSLDRIEQNKINKFKIQEVASFSYLESIPSGKITTDKANEIKDKIKEIEDELNYYESDKNIIITIWKKELKELLTHKNKFEF